MANLQKTLAVTAARTKDNNASSGTLALAARSLYDAKNKEVLKGDALSTSIVAALVADPVALVALSEALAGANA